MAADEPLGIPDDGQCHNIHCVPGWEVVGLFMRVEVNGQMTSPSVQILKNFYLLFSKSSNVSRNLTGFHYQIQALCELNN